MRVASRRPAGPAALVVVGTLVAVGVALAVVAGSTGAAAKKAAPRPTPSPARAAPAPTSAAGRGSRAEAAVKGSEPSEAEVTRRTAQAWAELPASGWAATLRRPTSWSTRPGGTPAGRLAALNRYGTPMVVAMVGPPRADGWARIELPVRPNGSTGWIRWRSARLDHTNYRVRVDIGTRTMTVLDGSRTVLTTPVAVGTPRTPTPTGSTYLWELVRPADPSGAYGPYIFGLALYSDAYSVFNGGEAQIGIHGNDEPSSIGEDASNGCVRLPDPVIADLAGVLPLGTPVTVTA